MTSRCGHPNPPDATVCKQCGKAFTTGSAIKTALNPYAPPACNLTQPATGQSLLAGLVGPKYDRYYAERWARKNPGWNWAAFFLVFLWLAYRKMYFYCVLFFLFAVVGHFIQLKLELPSGTGTAVNLITMILFGMYGNHWYQRHITCQSKAIRKLPAHRQPAALARQGGVSWLAVFGILLLFIVLQFSLFIATLMVTGIPHRHAIEARGYSHISLASKELPDKTLPPIDSLHAKVVIPVCAAA